MDRAFVTLRRRPPLLSIISYLKNHEFSKCQVAQAEELMQLISCYVEGVNCKILVLCKTAHGCGQGSMSLR
jgi:hypothetical protein